VVSCGLNLGLHLSQGVGFHQACLMFGRSCKRGIMHNQFFGLNYAAFANTATDVPLTSFYYCFIVCVFRNGRRTDYSSPRQPFSFTAPENHVQVHDDVRLNENTENTFNLLVNLCSWWWRNNRSPICNVFYTFVSRRNYAIEIRYLFVLAFVVRSS